MAPSFGLDPLITAIIDSDEHAIFLASSGPIEPLPTHPTGPQILTMVVLAQLPTGISCRGVGLRGTGQGTSAQDAQTNREGLVRVE